MTVTTREKAWEEVNKIFPTDYEKDYASSGRAGYDIYRHPTLNYYNRICDLGDRLEILTGEYGETVINIWIVEPETAEERAAQNAQPTLSEQVHEITFAVTGYDYESEKQKELYNKIKSEKDEFVKNWIASEFVTAWCKINGGWGEKWGSVRITAVEHVTHGNGGHYNVTALIRESAKD